MIYYVYVAIPLMVVIWSIYNLIKSSGSFSYSNPEEQKRYEEWLEKDGKNKSLIWIASIIIFGLMAIKEVI